MDPISVIAGITSIVLAAAHISKKLHELWGSYHDVPSTVKLLIHETYAINGALAQLQGLLYNEDPTVKSRQRFIQLDLLVNTVSAAMSSFAELQAEVDKLAAPDPTTRLMTFKLMWKENDMQVLLRQLQSHKTSLTLMLTILSSVSDSQIRKTLDEITAFMAIMSKDQQRMWYTMKRSNLFSADGQSLFSEPNGSVYPSSDTSTVVASENDDFLQSFTFDQELKSSTPYQRVDKSADFDDGKSILTVEDVTDILKLPLPMDTPDGGSIIDFYDKHVTKYNQPTLRRQVAVRNRRAPLPPLNEAEKPPDSEYTSRGCHNLFIMWLISKDEPSADSWAEHWGLAAQEYPEGTSENELNRQRNIHNRIDEEIKYYHDLGLFIIVYRRHLRFLEMMGPSDPDLEAFTRALEKTFDSFDQLRILHEELLRPLITCAINQSPAIRLGNILAIYNEWISKARAPYLNFTTTHCDLEINILRASQHCLVVRQYLNLCSKDVQAGGRGWQSLIKTPILKIRRISVLSALANSSAAAVVGDESIERKVLTQLKLRRRSLGADAKDPVSSYNFLFQKLYDDIETKLNNEILDQPVRHFKERLDLAVDLDEWAPKLKGIEKGSVIRHKGDLRILDTNGSKRFHVVIIDDYILLTKKEHIGSEPPFETELKYESSRARYLLSINPIPLSNIVGVRTPRGTEPTFDTKPPVSPRAEGLWGEAQQDYQFEIMVEPLIEGMAKNLEIRKNVLLFSAADSSQREDWISVVCAAANCSSSVDEGPEPPLMPLINFSRMS